MRVIREFALENNVDFRKTVGQELKMGLVLASCLSIVAFVRVVKSGATLDETLEITVALFVIVNISVVLGASLPFFLDKIKAGPSNAATTIQVLMDIAGVAITCAIAVTFLPP